MKKLKLYLDTSVIGGCFDEEFKQWSHKLIGEIKEGRKIMVVSEIVIAELEEAPQKVKNILEAIPENYIENVFLDKESYELAGLYLREGALEKGSIVDAWHIAIAVKWNADAIVSWNFKHIVNMRRIQLINAVNIKNGYAPIEIRSPMEVCDED